MLKFLVHVYQYAEVYAVLLSWVVIPLGYYAAYLFLHNHYGQFTVPAFANAAEPSLEKVANG